LSWLEAHAPLIAARLRAGDHISDEVVRVPRIEAWGEDTSGGEGPYWVLPTLFVNPSAAMAVRLELPAIDELILKVREDYSPWGDHQNLVVEHEGVIVDEPPEDGQSRTYQTADGPIHVRVLRQRIRRSDRQVYAAVRWRADTGLCSIEGFDPEQGRFIDLKPAWEALREYAGIRSKPGPKPGSGAKFASPEDWYAALNEHIRPRSKRVTADGKWFAQRLNLDSPTTLFKYMKRWGPPKIQDLRNGRF